MKFEEVMKIQAPAEQIYATYTAVSDWPKWDEETVSASIDGPFEVGTTGKIKPKGEPETAIQLVEVTDNKSFTVQCKLPLCKMKFVHELVPDEDGTEVTNIVMFEGLLSPVFGRLFGKKIQKGMQGSLQGLKQHLQG